VKVLKQNLGYYNLKPGLKYFDIGPLMLNVLTFLVNFNFIPLTN